MTILLRDPFTIPAENPIDVPQNSLELVVAHAGNSIEVRREEEAYSLLSLVADVGGVLGLFIGFNFLMIWDWMISVLITKSPKEPENNI